ncbi:MAG: rRNA maturation RNase YbeY [Phycisphaerales bacterium]
MNDRTSESEPPGRDHIGMVARSDSGGGLVIELSDPRGGLREVQSDFLRAKACEAARELGLSGEARVRIVDDWEMSALHERYGGVSGTTDVLTFDLRTEFERESFPRTMDVDILVCSDEAQRASVVRGHPAEHEMLLYILHGLLHCLGHDDHDEESYRAMHDLEDRVLETIGVGRLFGVPVRADGGRAP